MHYRELLKGVNAYALDRKSRTADFPARPHDEEPKYFDALDENRPLRQRVGIIVNTWGNCRRHIDDDELERGLRKYKRKHGTTVRRWKLSELSLWDCHDTIVDAFSIFADIVKYTGASKVLHILNPRFFVMWDCSIRSGYGCFGNGEGYFNFLTRCQREMKEVIDTYGQDGGDIRTISRRIYMGRAKSLTKILDEYNFARFREEWI